VGGAAIFAGWSWGALLIAYFVVASVLSRVGRTRKARLLEQILDKGDQRDALQVLANGGLYAIAALASAASHSTLWYAVGIGALTASAADTWATEIGTLSAKDPVSITTGRGVAAGTSGGITLVGSLAAIAGALFIASGAALARWPVPFTAAALGGIAGALADSLMGATLQSRRWCDVCAKATERRLHDCGSTTRNAGGLEWLDNDGVNAICSVVGSLITLVLSR
jgi:uncharacterized protein (TIGR00297 family)